MKKFLLTIFLMTLVTLSNFSCATTPTRGLAPGELRLLRLEVPQELDSRRGFPFRVNIHFEADGRPKIKTACFYLSGDGPYCFKITNVKYGLPGMVEVDIRTNLVGSFSLQGYVLYLRDGKTEISNKVSTLIHIIP